MFIGGLAGEVGYRVVRFLRDHPVSVDAVNRVYNPIDRHRESLIEAGFIGLGAMAGYILPYLPQLLDFLSR